MAGRLPEDPFGAYLVFAAR